MIKIKRRSIDEQHQEESYCSNSGSKGIKKNCIMWKFKNNILLVEEGIAVRSVQLHHLSRWYGARP